MVVVEGAAPPATASRTGTAANWFTPTEEVVPPQNEQLAEVQVEVCSSLLLAEHGLVGRRSSMRTKSKGSGNLDHRGHRGLGTSHLYRNQA